MAVTFWKRHIGNPGGGKFVVHKIYDDSKNAACNRRVDRSYGEVDGFMYIEHACPHCLYRERDSA